MLRFALALLPLAMSSAAFAQTPVGGASNTQFSDVAQVMSVTSISDRVNTPRQECWTEQLAAPAVSQRYVEPVQHQRHAQPAQPSQASSGNTSGAGAVIGAILGGIVGHQFGNSTGGKDRGTVAGAVVGGLIGNAVEGSSSPSPSAQAPSYGRDIQPSVYSHSAPAPSVAEARTVERCRTVQDTREQVVGYNVTYRYGNQQFVTRMAQDPGQTLRVRVSVAPEASR